MCEWTQLIEVNSYGLTVSRTIFLGITQDVERVRVLHQRAKGTVHEHQIAKACELGNVLLESLNECSFHDPELL